MRALLQRVSEASVSVAGETVGAIGPGLMILVCAMPEDDEATARRLADKVRKLRIFSDAEGRMNKALDEGGNAALVISQFTLAADTSRGNRPGFSRAAAPEQARQLYEVFGQHLREAGVEVAWGRFGTEMQVSLTNNGPTTIWIDTEAS